jgi:Mycothiol maleylpyruvate isomerase N-terminal domain
MTATTEKTTDLLVAVLADLAPMVGDITGEQLHDPTPCTELDVGQLRTHVLGWLTTFAAGFADADGQAPLDRLEGYSVPADPAAHAARGQRDAR